MKVLVIGLGYVGLKVSQFYSAQGAEVSITTTNPDRIEEIKSHNFNTFLIKPSDFSTIANILPLQDLILVSLAPNKNFSYEDTYFKSAINLFEQIKKTAASPNIIYLSSTSIYGDHQGDWVTEETYGLDLTSQAEILLQTESIYRQYSNVSILRLGEIYGPGRDMMSKIKSWENQLFPGNSESFINIIHLDDIVRGIFFLNSRQLKGIYNLVSDEHPKRKDLYTQISEIYGLKPIFWSENSTSAHKGNKRVSNKKIKNAGFNLLYPQILL